MMRRSICVGPSRIRLCMRGGAFCALVHVRARKSGAHMSPHIAGVWLIPARTCIFPAQTRQILGAQFLSTLPSHRFSHFSTGSLFLHSFQSRFFCFWINKRTFLSSCKCQQASIEVPPRAHVPYFSIPICMTIMEGRETVFSGFQHQCTSGKRLKPPPRANVPYPSLSMVCYWSVTVRHTDGNGHFKLMPCLVYCGNIRTWESGSHNHDAKIQVPFYCNVCSSNVLWRHTLIRVLGLHCC